MQGPEQHSHPPHPPASAVPARAPRRRRWIWLGVAAMACAPFGAVFIRSSLHENFDIGLSHLEKTTLSRGLKVFRPTLAARTRTGDPFILEAQAALPDGPMPEQVLFEKIKGLTRLPDGRKVALAAPSGMLYVAAQKVDLSGGVHIKANDGSWMHTEAAMLDMKHGIIASDGHIKASGALGTLRADKATVYISPPQGFRGCAGYQVYRQRQAHD